MPPDARTPAIGNDAGDADDQRAWIWTVGHSTLAEHQFLALLDAHGVQAVADVRRFPGSRRYPHFSESALRASLDAAGVGYIWLPSLGGRRRPAPESANTGWRNDSFRGYADHIASEEFATGLKELQALARTRRTAIMCSEAVWWRCHRSLISDVLKATGWLVIHILGPGQTKEHPYTSPARIVNGRLSYPAEQLSLGE